MTTDTGIVLNERTRMLQTPRGQWSIAAKHTRAGGDVDVILGFRVYGKARVQLFAFRGDQERWVQLSGSWAGVSNAIRDAERTTRTQVFRVHYVSPLLDLAALLDDFPSAGEE